MSNGGGCLCTRRWCSGTQEDSVLDPGGWCFESRGTVFWIQLGSKLMGLKSGHFVRRSKNIRSYTVSSVVDNLFVESNKTPFMA